MLLRAIHRATTLVRWTGIGRNDVFWTAHISRNGTEAGCRTGEAHVQRSTRRTRARASRASGSDSEEREEADTRGTRRIAIRGARSQTWFGDRVAGSGFTSDQTISPWYGSAPDVTAWHTIGSRHRSHRIESGRSYRFDGSDTRRRPHAGFRHTKDTRTGGKSSAPGIISGILSRGNAEGELSQTGETNSTIAEGQFLQFQDVRP